MIYSKSSLWKHNNISSSGGESVQIQTGWRNKHLNTKKNDAAGKYISHIKNKDEIFLLTFFSLFNMIHLFFFCTIVFGVFKMDLFL